MKGYYVEIYQSDGKAQEASAIHNTFDASFAWIEQRLSENAERIARVFTHARITPEQKVKLDRYGIAAA
jgi:hypothetical protein